MKIATTTMAAATMAVAGVIGTTPTANADNYPLTEKFGSQQELVDPAWTNVQEWTVTNLQPSSDIVPWPVHGKLWESTASVESTRGTSTPVITDFNARADNGRTYQALAVATPRGINPSPVGQGSQATGKIYFDVVGPTPDSVVYNTAGRDLLFWVR